MCFYLPVRNLTQLVFFFVVVVVFGIIFMCIIIYYLVEIFDVCTREKKTLQMKKKRIGIEQYGKQTFYVDGIIFEFFFLLKQMAITPICSDEPIFNSLFYFSV